MIDATTEAEAVSLIQANSPAKDPEIVEIFTRHDDYKRREEEYFEVTIYEVPKEQKIIELPSDNLVVLPAGPSKKIKF